MDDLDLQFLVDNGWEQGEGVVTIVLPDNTVSRVENVCPWRVFEKCPLLYHAFEESDHGAPQASIEASSAAAVVSLLRFIYVGDYLSREQEGRSSLLRHAQVYKIAEDFDLPELQVAAYVTFMSDVELSCSLPTPPLGLCETIYFIYRYLAAPQSRQENSLVTTLLNYCVNNFHYHHLGENEAFRKAVFDTPDFQRDLCQTSMKRDFQDECASEIMLLPVCRPNPFTRASLHKRALGDFQFDFGCDEDGSARNPTEGGGGEDNTAKRRKSDVEGRFMLVHRFCNSNEVAVCSEGESSSDEEGLGFTLVYRPKLDTKPAPQSDSEISSDAIKTESADDVPGVNVIMQTDIANEPDFVLETKFANFRATDYTIAPSDHNQTEAMIGKAAKLKIDTAVNDTANCLEPRSPSPTDSLFDEPEIVRERFTKPASAECNSDTEWELL